jgi:hypothetical protein
MSELVKKFRLKPGMRGLVLNAPDGFMAEFAPLPDGTTLSENAEGQEQAYEFVLAFAGTIAELNQYAPTAMAAVKRDALLWFAYPKGSSGRKTDINRDRGWEVVLNAKYDGVHQIALDETWSALRFRPAELIKRTSMARASRLETADK